MSNEIKKKSSKPLRVISPKLHHLIMEEFEQYHIHSYDVLLEGVKTDRGLEITIYFGESFTHKEMKMFSDAATAEKSDELTEFIQTVADTCKKAMIDEYFHRMAP